MTVLRTLVLASLLAAGLSWTAPAHASTAPVESIPVHEIVPGMIGEGRTVFSGREIESFKVTILGVLRNFGPNQNMILAELEGGPLEHTGVIAGMSGSPVYIDGKLIGAIAYAFPFAKDPIAGITPIQEMIEATETPRRRSTAAALSFPIQPEQLSKLAPNPRASIPLQSASIVGADSLGPYLGRKLAPITTPASLLGFPPETFEVVAPLLRQLGVEPVMGGAASTVPAESKAQADARAATLAPGGAVGVGLVTGDLQVSATGTVTHVDTDTDEVYAFGHPLFNLGPIQYPMTISDVHLVLPSLMSSFKMASSGATVGTWLQDRSTAIKGLLNVRPTMLPMKVDIRTSRGHEKSYQLEIVDDELFSPVLAYVSLIAVLQATERQFGNQTVKLSAWFETREHRINVEDIFTDQQAAISASAMVAAPLAFLLSNDFRDVQVKDIRVEVEASEKPRTATLLRAWLDSDEVAPGGSVELKLLLKSYRGDEWLETVEIRVPPNVRSGSLRVLVADAQTMSSRERREAQRAFVPRDMDQLVRAMNSLRKNNRLYVQLGRADGSGGVVSGEYLTSLPASVSQVLKGDDSSSSFTPVRHSTFWEHEVVTDYHVSGSRTLQLEVKSP